MGDEAHPQVKKDKPMNKQARRTESSGPVKADSVADYTVERLAAEGISHCFGVAGDYLFPICDAVGSSAKGRPCPSFLFHGSRQDVFAVAAA
jgi:hypothetical protein